MDANMSSSFRVIHERQQRNLTTMATGLVCLLLAIPAVAGVPKENGSYRVLPAIVRGNLAIFPVVASHTHETSQLMTLDDGVRSGQVTVTEAGDDRGLVRPGQPIPRGHAGAEVNRLVLYNNSNRPLSPEASRIA